jgi:transposase
MPTLFIGIDTSLAEHVVCAMDPDGHVVARTRVANDAIGLETLTAWCQAQATDYDRLAIGLEATSVYHWPLFETLSQAEALRPWDPQWFVLNPKVVQAFRQTYVDRAKTDRTDAVLIADAIRFGRLHPVPPPDPRFTALKVLTRHRHHLAQTIAAEKTRALTALFCLWGGYAHARDTHAFFSDVFGRASQHVLAQYTPDQLALTPLATLATDIAAVGGPRLQAPTDIAATLQTLARKAFRLHPQETQARHLSLVMHLDTIQALQRQLQALDKPIARELAAIPQTLTSIPGMGPVYGAGILAEIGPIGRFASDDALAKYAGLTWRTHQSGPFDAADRPLTRTGSSYLRYYLVEAADRVRVRDPHFGAFYARKYAGATHHAHHRALVLTARKLVSVIYGLLTRGQLYDGRRFGT